MVPINNSHQEAVNDIIDRTFNQTNQKNNPWILALDVIKNLFGSAKNISHGINWILLRCIYGTTYLCVLGLSMENTWQINLSNSYHRLHTNIKKIY